MKPSSPELFYAGRFLITDSISVVCSDFLFLHGSVFVGCTFLGIHPFLLGWPVFWHLFVYSSLYDPLYFCGISCNVSSFIYNFGFECSLFFSW